jgi:hypothetical protein
LLTFEIEEQIQKKNKIQEMTECMCIKPKDKISEEKQRKTIKELIDNAPTKEELATHDGIVYFPSELMPRDLV